MRFIAGLLLLAVAVGCRSFSKVHVPDLPVAQSREELYKHFDHEVTLVGWAEQREKEGTVIRIEDGTRVRVPEIAKWPGRVMGQRVTARGMLKRMTDPAGPAGSPDWFILQGVRWERGATEK